MKERTSHDLETYFYSIIMYVEEEIEKATAAQLEGFLVMKTKAITNSISKWVERSTFKVKLVIEWIHTRGK